MMHDDEPIEERLRRLGERPPDGTTGAACAAASAATSRGQAAAAAISRWKVT